jgi:sugar lactone lactonase YvrE
MKKTFLSTLLLCGVVGFTFWFFHRNSSGSDRLGSSVTTSSAPAHRAPKTGQSGPGSVPESLPATTGSQPSRHAVQLWASLIGMEGRKLEPLSSSYGALPRTMRPAGRIAYFDTNALASLGGLNKDDEVIIPLLGNDRTTGRVNLVQIEPAGVIRVGGNLTGTPAGSFSLTSTAGQLAGRILIPDQRITYEVTSPRPGQMMMREVDMEDVVCFRMPRAPGDATAAAVVRSGPQAAAPVLSSRPTATAVLYLDFDGATVTDPDWNNGVTIVAAPSPLTSDQITQVWNCVKENYSPFNIDVTTDPARYNSAAVGHRMRVIITPTDTADPGAGGVAYEYSFSQAGTNGFREDIPCWVFNPTVSSIAMAAAHELGHTLGLHHDGLTSPTEEYYGGQNGWGPIMGDPYYQTVVQWCEGEYLYANNQEDQVSILADTSLNGFGYVSDGVGDTRSSATPLNLSGTLFSATGTITSAADSDYYVFTTTSSKAVTIDVEPATYSPDLDVFLELQDSSGNVLDSINPFWAMNATVAAYPVAAGTYYIKICGAGRGNPLIDGYSNYGSIGYYSLTGSIVDGPGPVAPQIYSQPAAASVYVGTTSSFTVYANGTGPLAYQWSKDGVALIDGGRISGSTTGYLTISTVQSTDAGNYSVVVRNAQGSATSNTAALVVSQVPPPIFDSQPANMTVVQGNPLNLYAYASSPQTIAYQWYKDSQPLTGATGTWYTLAAATFADAGAYQVTATNSVGTSWSQTGTVTIVAATIPTIVTQPQSMDLYAGQNASLGVWATSNSTVAYQWYHDGAAISGATYSSYNISSASSTSAGIYTAVASTPAGSVTSAAAFVTVSSDLPPVITAQPPVSYYTRLGNPVYLSVTAIGTPPISYQWYHNGTSIAGATSSSYSNYNIATGDLGEYHVNVSNPNGTTVSNSAFVSLSAGSQPGYFWLDAQQQGSVVYFLHTIPLKIARFDLANGVWLDPWNLTRTPTAFAVGSDAIYVAYGADVVRYDSTFGNATTLCTAPQGIGAMVLAGQYLVTCGANNYPYTNIDSYDRSTGSKIAESSLIYSLAQGFSYCATANCIFGMNANSTPSLVYRLPIKSDGTFGTVTSNSNGSQFPGGLRTMMLADDAHVTDDGGVVFNVSDLSYVGSFGVLINDVVSAPGSGFYSLSGNTLHLHDDNYRQSASTQIGICASRLFHSGNTLYAFAQPASLGSAPAVQVVDVAQFQPPTAATAVNARCRPIQAPALLLDETGVLFVSSSSARNVFRWSADGRRYLRPIPLSSTATHLAYSAPNRTLYYAGSDTQLRSIAVAGSSFTEAPFYSSPSAFIAGFQSAGEDIYVVDGSSGTTVQNILSTTGTSLSRTTLGYGNYLPAFTWSETNRRMYLFGYNSLMYEGIASDGTISGSGSTPYAGNVVANLPIRVSPDGATVVLGSGQLFDGVTLTLLGTLQTTNVTDATWTPGTLHILHASTTGTEVQSIPTSSYQIQRTASFPGKPLALFTLADDRLLLVTSTLDNYLQYWRLSSADLSVLSHDDTRTPAVYHDFNGDSFEDLVWRDTTTGAVTIWLMNGTGMASSVSAGTIDTAWRLAGEADMNNDGQPDIVWQNTQTGEFGYWAMNGTTKTDFVSLGTTTSQEQIVGIADFNDDGQADIVWQNTSTGDCSVSMVNNGVVGGSTVLGNVGSGSSVVAVGDFNGDGIPDLVIRNTATNEYAIQLMQPAAFGNSVSLGIRGADWQLASTGDFNGDGFTDIVWENSRSGERELWLMHGTSFSSVVVLQAGMPTVPTTPTVSELFSNGFTVRWSGDDQTTDYRLDVSTSSDFSTFVSSYQDKDVGNVTTCHVYGLGAGTAYYVRVRAANSAGTSASSASSATITGPAQVVDPAMIITTLAGWAGSVGVTNGTGSSARFNFPSGIAVDSGGTVYVADTNNHTIRAVSPSGSTANLAGSGAPGFADGYTYLGSTRFNSPSGIAVDSSGSVYVADTLNHTIRKIAFSVVTTIAGSAGSSGATDATGTAARFNCPQGLVLDGSGNLYIADTNNHSIRKLVLATGVVSTVAGQSGQSGSNDGVGTAAHFNAPSGVGIDASENLFVADTENNLIRQVAPSGSVTTVAGSAAASGGRDGTGSNAWFDAPSDLTVDDAGNVYVADTDGHAIRKIVPSTGVVTTVAGSVGFPGSSDGSGSSALFYYPTGIASARNGVFYIADTNNQTIRAGLLALAPAIQTQPQSQTVTAGASVQLSVTATGRPAPVYQWYLNGIVLSGATSSSFSLASAQSANSGSYTVTVTNEVGTVTSSQALLTVNLVTPPPNDGGGGSGGGTGGAASSSGGGGGGAHTYWFGAALVIATALRRTFHRRR